MGTFKNLISFLLITVGANPLLFAQSLTSMEKTTASEKTATMESSADGIIEVHLPEEIEADYNERKSPWCFRINLISEQMLPSQFVSPVDGKTYMELFGTTPVQMPGIGLGFKRNFSIGGIYLDAIYGKGNVNIGTGLLALEKTGINFGITLDAFFSNPWVSPFAGGQAVYFKWSEADTNIEKAGLTAMTTGIIVGLAIHLNRIDKQTATEAYNEHGLKNTFLDVYAIQYNTSNSKEDPDFKTATNVGAALRLEF